MRSDPRVGFGNDLDTVLHLSEEDVRRIVRAFGETFLGMQDLAIKGLVRKEREHD